MPSINGHSVTLHRVVDLRHDGLPSRLDTQHGRHFVRVVRCRFTRFDARCRKNLSQIVTFDKKFVLCRSDVRVVNVDDGAIDRRKTFNNDRWQTLFEELEATASCPGSENSMRNNCKKKELKFIEYLSRT